MEYNIYSINEAIYNLIELPDNATILDIGCRNACYLKDILEKFPNKINTAIGIDITDKHFDEVNYKAPIELIVMNCADGLTFEDNKFDLIIAKDVLECITDKLKFIKEIHRVLKPNGVIVCANADFDSITLNGKDKDLITKAIHAYAITKQKWMDDLDSWMGRRTYSIFNKTTKTLLVVRSVFSLFLLKDPLVLDKIADHKNQQLQNQLHCRSNCRHAYM